MSAPLAHSGHWLTSLVYVAPVAILVVILAVQSLGDRRRGRGGGSSRGLPDSERER